MNDKTAGVTGGFQQPPVRDPGGRRVPRPLRRTAGFALLLILALAGCGKMGPAGSAQPVVTIAPAASVAEGGPPRFLVRAAPAPTADLTVAVTIASPDCTLTQAPKSVTIAAGKTEATLTVPTSGSGAGAEGCTVTATIAAGAGYTLGGATVAATSETITPATETPGTETPVTETPVTETPVVTVTATAATVTEGSPVSFTLTAAPPPSSALTVNVSWSESGSFLTGSRPQTVTIPTSGTASLSADTADDGADEPDGSVTLTVAAGSGYTVGNTRSATTAVEDDDARALIPVVTMSRPVVIDNSITFKFTATPAPASTLTVSLTWKDSSIIANGMTSTVDIPTTGKGTLTMGIKKLSPGQSGVAWVLIAASPTDSYEIGYPYGWVYFHVASKTAADRPQPPVATE